MFRSVKKPAKEIYHRDKGYLRRLFSIVIALYLVKDILLALASGLPTLAHRTLEGALEIAFLPFGMSITHMLIHEEHYDHMKADGLFRFYRSPKTMLQCMILGICTTGLIKAAAWGLEAALHPLLHHHHTLLFVVELVIFVAEEALVAYFFLVQYLFVLHRGHSLWGVVRISLHAMKGDILHHLCFDFSLFAWYLLPVGAWLLTGGLYHLITTGTFLLPALSARALGGDLLSILYTVYVTVFHFFYTPYVAMAKILFAEHAWEEALEYGKIPAALL